MKLPFWINEERTFNGLLYARSRAKRLFLYFVLISFLCYLYYLLNSLRDLVPKPLEEDEDTSEIVDGTPAPPVSEFLLSDESERLTRKVPVTHVFVNSAYYYPISKSLGRNAIALHMIVDSKNFDSKNYSFGFVGSNGTNSEAGLAKSMAYETPECRYSPTVAIGNTIENLIKLELDSNGTKTEIPFKIARFTAPKPVIICINPQFVAEQWQTFLMHVHTANRFGGHLHVYIVSIVNGYFELMKEYERQGYLTMEMWLRMKFPSPGSQFFEPNMNSQSRNSAMTDCLLQYKEATEYIAFFDMDDILFPLLYPTYLEEFNAAWTPGASSLIYGRRSHQFVKAETLTEYNFHRLVDSLRTLEPEEERVVLKPEAHRNSWEYTGMENK
uniref:Glycosyltransferase family 92 protein n=1 Tax=Caenorhabditis tropicalis TaxID=1561998 RepID=A0A1I7V446_9PELO